MGVGSNVGDREHAIAEAAVRLVAASFTLSRVSRLFETQPVGGPPQGWYLNGVFGGDTDLTPQGLLDACLDVERAMGRVRSVANAPRIIDLDVLLFGDVTCHAHNLTIPHPRLHLRRFVLVPLAEIAPSIVHPSLRLTVTELLARCTDTSVVRPVSAAGAPA